MKELLVKRFVRSLENILLQGIKACPNEWNYQELKWFIREETSKYSWFPIVERRSAEDNKELKMKKAFTEEMYQTAVRKLKRDGFVKRTYLIKLFGVREVDRVHSFFESHGNPLYEELIEEDVHVKGRKSYKRHIKIYKPFNDLVAEWRRENCRNGLYTNTPYQHMGINV